MSDTTTPAAEAADTLADVAGTHTVTEAERAALAEADNDTGTTGSAPEAAAEPPAPQAVPAPPEAPPEAEAAAAAAPAPAAAPVQQAQQNQPAPAPRLQAVPEPPKDFEAEFKALDARFDSGELDDDERNAAFRALTIEQARYEGQKASVEAFNQAQVAQAAAAAAQSFDQAASAWTAAHKDFMANPLRAQALQQAINTIDTETQGTLAPTELIERAAKVAFDAYGWNPAPAAPATPAQPAAERTAAALQGRIPPTGQVPRTLGDAPTSGADTGTSKFAALDNMDVLGMERAIAGMSPAEQDAWLREVDAPIS